MPPEEKLPLYVLLLLLLTLLFDVLGVSGLLFCFWPCRGRFLLRGGFGKGPSPHWLLDYFLADVLYGIG